MEDGKLVVEGQRDEDKEYHKGECTNIRGVKTK